MMHRFGAPLLRAKNIMILFYFHGIFQYYLSGRAIDLLITGVLSGGVSPTPATVQWGTVLSGGLSPVPITLQ